MRIKHIISAQQFDKDTVTKLFKIADEIQNGKYNQNFLNKKIMATLFYEPSTRTRFSFESAMIKLGGSTISTENAKEFSSAIKGETLEDTIRIVDDYCDVIVIRHPKIGSARLAASYSTVPVINAGDGGGEHPTQALLDLYTIFSKVKNPRFTIAMAGALSVYRSVHSLSYLLANYPSVNIIFVSPKSLRIPTDFRKYFSAKKVRFSETEDYLEAIKKADVIYQTRIPKEYLGEDYKKYSGKYILDKKALKYIKKTALILHPLPRVDEISQEVDSDPRALYFEQAHNGVFVRMALLKMLFDNA